MNKFILIPDSFKGTMSSSEICEIMKERVQTYFPEAQVISIPVADGGEGTVDAFLTAIGGEKVTIPAKGPHMEDIRGFYGIVDSGRTAIIEMAACAGLPLAGGASNVEEMSTFGVGQLMVDAAMRGCKKLIVGLGGSATNDFGVGAAAAAGIRFLDKHGQEFLPVGGTLSQISSIDKTDFHSALKDVEIVTMCDIDNPLYGENGAAYIFAPQKGASPDMVKHLDGHLRAVANTVQRELGIDVSSIPGAGAAGGMGGGMIAFFHSRLQMGIETVLDTVDFDKLAQGSDMIFTGEGKMDSQSLRGKVVIGVANRAKNRNIPVIAVVGDIGDNIDDAYKTGITAIFSINRVAVPFIEAKKRSRSDLRLTMDNIMRLLCKFNV